MPFSQRTAHLCVSSPKGAVQLLAQGNALDNAVPIPLSPERVVNKTINEKFVSYYQYITISSQTLCPVRVQNVFQARITTF
jgi:hypothetical protein